MIGHFFTEDTFLASLNPNEKIKNFILSFDKVFGEKILDEVFIITYKDSEVVPIYFFCGKDCCDEIMQMNEEQANKIKKMELVKFDFFIKNIISRMCIINNECVLAKDISCDLFDAVFRMDDYYIGLNNSKSCFRELKERLNLTEETFINIVKNFYNDLRKV